MAPSCRSSWAPITWSRETCDSEGRCLVRTPRGQGFAAEIRRAGFLPTRFGARGTTLDAKSFTVPLYAAIQGRVIDTNGKPVEGIQVGRLIAPNYDTGLDKPSQSLEVYPPVGSEKPATTDSEGRFRVEPRVNLRDETGKLKVWPMPVVFADAALKRICFLRVDLEAAQPASEITLHPARHVRIPIQHEVAVPSGSLDGWWELNDLAGATKSDPGLFVMQGLLQKNAAAPNSPAGDWIDSYWPEGRYRVQVNSVDRVAKEGAEETSAEIVVPPGDGTIVLPPIRMKELPLRGLVGKPAPEIDASDLSTGDSSETGRSQGQDHCARFLGLLVWTMHRRDARPDQGLRPFQREAGDIHCAARSIDPVA